MKNIPEIRFKDFNNKWEVVSLGDVGKVSMNKRIFKDQTSETGDVPFYKIGTFGKEPDSYISYELFNEYKSKYPYPNKGDLLISASGSIGKIVEFDGSDSYYQDSNIVWLEINDKITNPFLKQIYNIVNWNGLEGSTIKRLYNKDILETKISITDIEEQSRIGNLFKNIDELIENQESMVDSLESFKKSMLQKMFPSGENSVPEIRFSGFNGDWEVCKLKYVSTEIKKGVSKLQDLNEGNVEYLDAERLNGGIPFFSDGVLDTLEDDILILWDGSRAGTLYTDFKGTLGSTLKSIRLKPEFNSYFIYSFLKLNENLIIEKYTTPNIPHVIKDFFDIFDIYSPSLPEQEKIGNFFKNLDLKISNEESLLDSYKNLKKSLLQKMFI